MDDKEDEVSVSFSISSSSSSSSSNIHTLYRPRAQSGVDKLRGSQPTLDLDVESLENQNRNAAASPIAYFPQIQHALRPNMPK